MLHQFCDISIKMSYLKLSIRKHQKTTLRYLEKKKEKKEGRKGGRREKREREKKENTDH